MNTPAVILSDSFITANFGGKSFIVNEGDERFPQALKLYSLKDWQGLHDLMDSEAAVRKLENYSGKNVTIKDGEVFHHGRKLNNYVIDKILAFSAKGFPYEPILKFLDNLLESHSWDVVKDLYQFLEKAGDMPITEDGAFLAYKKVDENWMSYHANPDGTHNRNMPGDVNEMPPHEVNPDRNVCCAPGLHFCSEAYLPQFYGDSGKVVRVKIFPQWVIAIPTSYNNAKARAYKYEVVCECPDLHDLAFGSALCVGNEPYTGEDEEDIFEDEFFDDGCDDDLLCGMHPDED